MDGRISTEELPRDEEAEEITSSVQVDVELIQSMKSQLPVLPKLTTKSASCSIFRVSQVFTDSDVNARSYQPRTVSIGPYHRGKPHLREMEKHKWRFLARAIARTGVQVDCLIKEVKRVEEQARKSYSEAIPTPKDKPNEFLEMLVLDGVFVIEILRAFSNVVPFDKDDLFGSMQWMRFRLRDDFLCLENQIPYIVLQKLFELTEMVSDRLPSGSRPTLFVTALHLFTISDEVGREPEKIGDPLGWDFEGLHLLDLVRKSYFPKGPASEKRPSGAENVLPVTRSSQKTPNARNIRSVSKLRRVGIDVKLRKHYTFLQVEYKRGVIWMPPLELDDTMCAFLLNCVAFEQCHKGKDRRMSEYAKFLDCLIDTHEDVDLLCEAKILRHHFATQREVADFVIRLGNAAACNVAESYLIGVYVRVAKHYRQYDNKFHVYWVEVRNTYFRSPWTALSLLAALVLLALTVAQTIYTIYPYYHPHEEKHATTTM
ncbi:unnamed protein product [Cuscuta epithymum]|uniref:Uncharacterized protein n=1 Tax=Cuscuta epithymum TaxID=186058 RepID=A0AAV0ELK7_9ASTE|nr:unnamed protein product [Cuscuta epithymum]